MRMLPAGRAVFDDLKIKPPLVFNRGLLWRDRKGRKLLAGSMLPQCWIRTNAYTDPVLSADVLGLQWSPIGFGVDLAAHLDVKLIARWSWLGGVTWQWCQNGDAQNLTPKERRLIAMDEIGLPELPPTGWVAIVRPDRYVMVEVPCAEIEPLLRRALKMLEPTPPIDAQPEGNY